TEIKPLTPARVRATDTTLRDTPLDPSERAAIDEATRRTLLASPPHSLRKALEPAADPLVIDPSDQATAFRPNPLSHLDAVREERPAVAHVASKPVRRSRREQKRTWPEVLLILIAAASVGALVYTAVLHYFIAR